MSLRYPKTVEALVRYATADPSKRTQSRKLQRAIVRALDKESGRRFPRAALNDELGDQLVAHIGGVDGYVVGGADELLFDLCVRKTVEMLEVRSSRAIRSFVHEKHGDDVHVAKTAMLPRDLERDATGPAPIVGARVVPDPALLTMFPAWKDRVGTVTEHQDEGPAGVPRSTVTWDQDNLAHQVSIVEDTLLRVLTS